MSSKSERTEKPTARRLRDARKKGQIARTRDLTQAASLVGLVTTLSWTGTAGLGRLGAAMEDALHRVADGSGEMVAGTVTGLVVMGGQTVALVVGPVAVAVMTLVVVITNPTEYAVALEYDREQLPAPRVLGKGRNLVARRMREIAREHDVPIVENRPLAQELFRATEVGDVIPPALFDAVAEVIVYLVRLKQVVL